MKKLAALAISLVITLLGTQPSLAHSGRTDGSGGHWDRKRGTYHYHNGGGSRSNDDDEAERRRRAEQAERRRQQEQEEREREEAKEEREEAERLRLEEVRRQQAEEAEAERLRWEAAHDYQDLTDHRSVYTTPSHLREIYKVVEVVDGDTIKVDFDGDVATVRLIGVDTPETVHPNKDVEEFGKEASYFLRNLLIDEWIWLDTSTEGGTNTDKYGRLLGYAYRYPDGMFVNLEIIRQGYGHAYVTYPFSHMEDFRFYETKAREAGRGLWGDYGASAAKQSSYTSSTTVPDRYTPWLWTGSVGGDSGSYTSSDANVTVYITKTGQKYHRGSCKHLAKSKIPITLKEAKDRGFGACKHCDPPTQAEVRFNGSDRWQPTTSLTD